MSKSVIIYGSGVAGMQLAKALDGKASVTVVSPIDYYEVPMAMPRNLVEPGFAARSTVSLSSIPGNVTHVQGKLVSFSADGGVVERADGTKITLTSDISVLATGSSYANSVTRAQSGKVAERKAEIETHAQRLRTAQRVVIVGGGPIGVELAGEISQDYPDKSVTLVESGDGLLNGTSRKVAGRAQSELEGRGVKIVLGDRIVEPGYGQEPEGGVARTSGGKELPYDMIFWAVGSKPNTDYMPKTMLTAEGRIPVDTHLQVKGMNGVFALGDVTDLNEVKKAIYTNNHVPVAAKNITAILNGQPPKATYKAKTGDDTMVVTLGRSGGVAHFPGMGMVKANWIIRMLKSRDMLTGMFRKGIGAPK